MGINLEAIKKRAIDGLEGKTPLNGERTTVGKFTKDFTDKASKGLDAFAQEVHDYQQDKDANTQNKDDDMQI